MDPLNTHKLIKNLDKKIIDSITWVVELQNRVFFLNSSQELYGIGQNEYGELGIGSYYNYAKAPMQINLPSKVKKIAGGDSHTVFLLTSGAVYVCGKNDENQIYQSPINSDNNNIYRPKKVQVLRDIISISCGIEHSLALDNNGELYVWGKGSHGQLGNDSCGNISSPKRLEFFNHLKVLKIKAVDLASYAYCSNNQLYGWGLLPNELIILKKPIIL